jgi:serine/threonine-protein kinase
MAGAEEPLSGMFRGKLGYMPPEQVCGEPIDGRVDLFAVGVMLWEAVTGKRLWGELHHAGIIRRLLEHDIPQLADAAPEADPELARICSRALAPLRDQRYPDAAAFLRDLEQYLDTLGGSVSSLTLGEMVQRSCADLKRAREEALRAALAQLHDWQLDEQPEPAATLLPLDSPLDLAPLTARRARRARRLRWLGWAGSLIGCLLAGMLLARQSLPGTEPLAAPAAPVAASAASSTQLASAVILAAPSAVARQPLAAPVTAEPPAPRELVTGASASLPAPQPARVRKPSKAQRSAKAPARAPRRLAAATKPAQPVAALPAPCEPPYVIDAHGIKRFRRDCMATP